MRNMKDKRGQRGKKREIRKDFRHRGNGLSSSPVVSFVVSIREIYGFAFTNTLFYRGDLSKYREFAPIELNPGRLTIAHVKREVLM